MKQIVELHWSSLSKDGEELCGDNVRVCSNDRALMVVLSDGLGSGVKANILSTLTAQIAITMFEQGAHTDEVMATLADTLPECQTRRLAYATFAMLRVLDGRQAFLVEYDSPPLILVRGGRAIDLPKGERIVSGRPVREASFELCGDDYLVMISDGYEHAGVGSRFPLGWGWPRIAERVCALSAARPTSLALADRLGEECLALYDGHPGDDATVVAMHVRPVVSVTIWTGPPADKALDEKAVEMLMSSPATKVICGGTTAQIAARVLGRELKVDWLPPSRRVDRAPRQRGTPPIAHLEGVDLVTEGILTLGKAIELLERQGSAASLSAAPAPAEGDAAPLPPTPDDAALALARLLLAADEIHLIVGTALNPNQVADLLRGEPMRHFYVKELVRELEHRQKKIVIDYI